MKGWTSENIAHLTTKAIIDSRKTPLTIPKVVVMRKALIPEGILPVNRIFIAGNVPSLKNSKQIVRTKTGLPFITSSKLCKKYTTDTKMQFVNNVGKFYNLIVGPKPLRIKFYFRRKDKRKFDYINVVQILLDLGPKPLRIKFYFIRKDKRKFDYINVVQILLDLMIKYEYIADDNMDEVIPVFGGYHVDSSNPGVYIYF